MTLHQLADELIEIRRFVRTHPEHVAERLAEVKKAWVKDVWGFKDRLEALAENTHVGLNAITINPAILEGYLYGAAAEIREAARKLEPKEEPA